MYVTALDEVMRLCRDGEARTGADHESSAPKGR